VDTILVLAKKLGLRCVAEGVETEAQLEFLRALGCAEYQGYLFARPCPAGEFAQLLLRRNTHRREFATP
jgi:EAL domain-containing protein (putative c-di-GMP-specific phosphodiesterase class I)